MFGRTIRAAALATAVIALASGGALAQKKYDTGATDTEIKVGNLMPYSGPGSAYGVIGQVEAAYFKMINDKGGINGRKVNFISYDDAYSPPKAVEQTRKLVESDEVLLMFDPLGTANNTAIQKYLNSKKVPQLFVAAGATKFNDPKNFPWTTGWQPSYQSEARAYAKYILKEKPNAKVAVFFQNDDLGKDYLKGLKDKLGAQIVAEESYETTEPTIDTHIVKLKASGADTLVNISSPKFAAQAIKKIAEIDWKPLHILSNVSSSIGSVIKPAGFENAQGVVSATYLKDPSDPQWDNDPGMKEFQGFLAKYYPEGNKRDILLITGYALAETLAQTLKQCGDDLTRENVMKQAANLKDWRTEALLPGIYMNTSPTDFAPISQLRLMRLSGEKWELFGDVINGDTDD
ncbi:ABC transporter substrate-binding protein [Bradyrhizobium manausense]|uniref:ABC transporter substrate-binding protein n=1 Tax=Bradyrhizobium manausense TaxID=989370 RepID=UPI001BA4C610|nr:ABC transporter substrate-binding protein [Bradyrhizobium manausense]MBR0836884.1 ABC transporter substrate-binding protein [Bradyrhizobium manausense]